MKKLFFLPALCILLFGINAAQAQKICFNAIDTISSQPVELDGIRIIAKYLNIDTLITEMEFDISAYVSGVEDDNASGKLIIPLSENPFDNRFSFAIGADEQADVLVYDIAGRQVHQSRIKGIATIDLSNYLPGVYVLCVSSGSLSESFKLCKTGHRTIHTADIPTNKIKHEPLTNEDSTWKFYPYSKGFRGDTVFATNIYGSRQIVFKMDDPLPQSDWYFSSVHLRFEVHNVLRYNYHWDQMNQRDTIWYDSATIKIEKDYYLFNDKQHPDYLYSIKGDSVELIHNVPDNGSSIKFMIDSNSNTLNEFVIFLLEFSISGTTSVEKRSEYYFDNLSFDERPDRYFASFNGNDLISIIIKTEFKWSGNTNSNFWRKDFTLPETDPDAELTITLYK